MAKLTVVGVRNAKPGRHGDGAGLFLLVKESGAKSWLLRVQVAGQRRDIGLGSVSDLTLQEAREKAALLRKVARAGGDPIAERDKDKKQAPTFKVAATACHAELKRGWEPKHAAAWLSSMEEHAFPALGKLRVDSIEASNIRDALAPIWVDKPVMARKVRQRIGAVLDFAKSKGWRSAETPARSVTVGLSRQPRGGNFSAMPYADVPGFIATLQGEVATVGRLALLFTILTAARGGEVRSARWRHIDFDAALWRRPADLMKTRTAHEVTLNEAALAVLEQAKKLRTTEADALIFPGKGGKPLSDMTLTKALRDAGQECTVHGFRSAFRDWAAERMPSVPEAVAEAALAHTVPDAVVRAYKRTTFVDLRRQLLAAWGDFCTGTGGKVVQLATAR